MRARPDRSAEAGSQLLPIFDTEFDLERLPRGVVTRGRGRCRWRSATPLRTVTGYSPSSRSLCPSARRIGFAEYEKRSASTYPAGFDHDSCGRGTVVKKPSIRSAVTSIVAKP